MRIFPWHMLLDPDNVHLVQMLLPPYVIQNYACIVIVIIVEKGVKEKEREKEG